MNFLTKYFRNLGKPDSKAWVGVLIFGIIVINLGVFAIGAPISLANIFMTILGVFMLASALVTLIPAIRGEKEARVPTILLALLGAFILFSPQSVWSLVIGLIGLMLFLSGGLGIAGAIAAGEHKRKGIPSGLLVSSLTTIAGAIMFGNRNAGMAFFMLLFGIMLLFFGALIIVSAVKIRNWQKEFEELRKSGRNLDEFYTNSGFNQDENVHDHPFSSFTVINMNDVFSGKQKDPFSEIFEKDDVIKTENLADNEQDTTNKKDNSDKN